MDDFQNPVASAQTFLAIVKFWHVMIGLYLWEFFTTLDYEWRVIRGHLPYRWSIWVYSVSRMAALVGAILCLVSLDVTTPINCQLLVLLSAIFLNLSAITAMLLIVLRIIAIWNRNKIVMMLAFTVWGTSAVFHIQSAARLRSAWIPGQLVSEAVKTKSSVLSFIPTIICDIVLLLIVLVGLLVLRHHDGGKFGLTHFLWKQGVISLALGTAAEVPPFVLILMNLNYQFNIMFETPCLVTMVIAATRMHRSLVEFASRPFDMARHENLQVPVSSLVFSNTKRRDTVPTTLHRIEIAVDTAFEQHPTAQISGDFSSDISTTSTHTLPTVSSSPIPQVQSV